MFRVRFTVTFSLSVLVTVNFCISAKKTTEILSANIEECHLLMFGDGLFLSFFVKSTRLWKLMHIAFRYVNLRNSDLYATLKS